VRLEAAAGYRLPGVRGWGHFRGSKRPEVGPVQGIVLNNFYIGRLAGTEGVVWQYSACDVASSYTWAELHVTPKNPSAHWTSALARRVAHELSQRGRRLALRVPRYLPFLRRPARRCRVPGVAAGLPPG